MSGASATGNVCVQRPAERCESAGSDCGWSSRTPWPEKATDLTRRGLGPCAEWPGGLTWCSWPELPTRLRAPVCASLPRASDGRDAGSSVAQAAGSALGAPSTLRLSLRHSLLPPLRAPPRLLACARQVSMEDYPRTDPYRRSRHEQGVDAKIVIMGNTGMSFAFLSPPLRCAPASRPRRVTLPAPSHRCPQVSARPACCTDIPRTSSIPRIPLLQQVLFS